MGFVRTGSTSEWRPCANIIVYQHRAIVHSASAAYAPATCKMKTAAAGVHLLLCFQPPIETCCLTTSLFIAGQRSLHQTTGRLTLWLTTGSLTSPARGQISLGWWPGGTGLVWRSEQSCWLWYLTRPHSSLWGQARSSENGSPAESSGWATIQWGWTRSCIPLCAWPPGPCSGLPLLDAHQSARGHAH